MEKNGTRIFAENTVARVDPDLRRLVRQLESSRPPRRYPRRPALSGEQLIRLGLVALAVLGVGLALTVGR